LEYRFSSDALFPAQIEDCKAGIRWLRSQALKYQIDPARVGVCGEFAGGHLAALIGFTTHLKDFDVGEHPEQSEPVRCVVDLYGPTDLLHYGDPPASIVNNSETDMSVLLGGIHGKKESWRRRRVRSITCAATVRLF
jgi:acetyl esterase/lipase